MFKPFKLDMSGKVFINAYVRYGGERKEAERLWLEMLKKDLSETKNKERTNP